MSDNKPPATPNAPPNPGNQFGFQLLRYQRDALEATNSLIYTLYAINLAHVGLRLIPSDGSHRRPPYPPIRCMPHVAGAGKSPTILTQPGGRLEQDAFRTWLTEIYKMWDSGHRNAIQKAMRLAGVPKAIRPEADPLGDIRLIRNAIVHNSGVADAGCGKCKVLRWFTPGDRIQLRMSHVLDFLNHMGWLSTEVFGVDEVFIVWQRDWTHFESVRPAPPFVSARPLIFEPHDFHHRYAVDVVFEDGVFGQLVVTGAEKAGDEQWLNMRIDQAGDISVSGEPVLLAKDIYPKMFGPPNKGGRTFSAAFRYA